MRDVRAQRGAGERMAGDDSRAMLQRAAEISAGNSVFGKRLPRPLRRVRPSLRLAMCARGVVFAVSQMKLWIAWFHWAGCSRCMS
ncbi:MAG: hypothetical protein QOH00_3160 [Gaiellales bacterium]|nr:hypothetical protein [Gaiellales bacterium]